jgi:hypothetical protein
MMTGGGSLDGGKLVRISVCMFSHLPKYILTHLAIQDNIPSKIWGQHDTPRFRLFNHLSQQRISSADMLACDDLLARSIFGQKTSKSMKRSWTLQTMMVGYVSNSSTESDILREFEQVKPELNRCLMESLDTDVILKMVKELSLRIIHKHLMTQFSEGVCTAVQWWVVYSILAIYIIYLKCHRQILSHTLPLLSGSAVALKVVELGGHRQLTVVTKRPLLEGELLYDLIGLMPTDSLTPHSHLSEIFPHSSQPAKHQARVLDGSIRFLNHSCHKFNAEVSGLIFWRTDVNADAQLIELQWIAIEGQLAFTVQTLKAISSGEEILVNYGKEYFDEQFPCKCATCSEDYNTAENAAPPSTQHLVLPTSESELHQGKGGGKGRHNKEYRIRQKAQQKIKKARRNDVEKLV